MYCNSLDLDLPCVLVDLDGTLFDNSARADLVPPVSEWAKPAAWASYEAAVGKDLIVWPVHEFVTGMINSGLCNVVFCTARFATSRGITLAQLQSAGLPLAERTALAMRNHNPESISGRILSPGEFKAQVVRHLRDEGFLVQWAIDDSKEVCAALEAEKVTTLMVSSKCAAVRIENSATEQQLVDERAAHNATRTALATARAWLGIAKAKLAKHGETLS